MPYKALAINCKAWSPKISSQWLWLKLQCDAWSCHDLQCDQCVGLQRWNLMQVAEQSPEAKGHVRNYRTHVLNFSLLSRQEALTRMMLASWESGKLRFDTEDHFHEVVDSQLKLASDVLNFHFESVHLILLSWVPKVGFQSQDSHSTLLSLQFDCYCLW